MTRYLLRILDYIFRMAPGFLLAAALFLALYGLRKRRLTCLGWYSLPLREGVLLLFWMFCGGMAMLTLTPGWFDWRSELLYGGHSGSFFALGSVNLTPFQTFSMEGHSLFLLLGNIVMFIPFGFFAALLWRGFTWRRALITGIAITGFIECWQMLVGRAFDIDDLMLNTLGVFCGFLLSPVLRRLFPRFTEKLTVSPFISSD